MGTKRLRRILCLTLAAALLILSSIAITGCSCSKTDDQNGDDMKKKTAEKVTVVGSWHLTQALDQNNNSLDLDKETLAKSTIIVKDDMSATMSFVDGTFLGKIERTTASDRAYQDAWNHYSVEAYTFKTSDNEVEIEFAFIVRSDGSKQPFILLPIDMVNYYYDK